MPREHDDAWTKIADASNGLRAWTADESLGMPGVSDLDAITVFFMWIDEACQTFDLSSAGFLELQKVYDDYAEVAQMPSGPAKATAKRALSKVTFGLKGNSLTIITGAIR